MGQRHHVGRAFGVHQHLGRRVLAHQLLQLKSLEFVVHDARTLPHQHVGPGFALDVGAQVLVWRPQDFVPAFFERAHDVKGAARCHQPVGARLHGRAGVGIDHYRALGVLVAKGGKFVDRATEVERAGGVEVGHEHGFVRRQNFGRLAHEAHAADHQRLRCVLAPKTRHL